MSEPKDQIPDIQELEEQIQKDLDSFKVSKKLFHWVGLAAALLSVILFFSGATLVEYGLMGIIGVIFVTDAVRESKQQVLEYHLHKLQHLNGIIIADIQSLSAIAKYSGAIEVAKKNWEDEIEGVVEDTKLH